MNPLDPSAEIKAAVTELCDKLEDVAEDLSRQAASRAGHPNLSPELNAAVQAGDENKRIDITAQKKGVILDVLTRNTTYTIVVVDPKKNEVAMVTTNPQINETDLWCLIGSGRRGSSLTKIGWVVTGFSLRMRRLNGGLIETSPVKDFHVRNDIGEAKRIVDEAELRRPKSLSEEEKRQREASFADLVEKIITGEFPAEKQESIREMTGRFANMSGKAVVLWVLSQAQKYDKLDKAFELLERDWNEHWKYQPPQLTGDPEFMPVNTYCWEALYRELGIPYSGEENGRGEAD